MAASERTISNLDAEVTELRSIIAANETNLEVFFYVLSAIFVFTMQLGFALLEAGTVRSKNVKTALLKNLLDLSITALVWYFIGNSLSGASGMSEEGIANAAMTKNSSSMFFLNTNGNYDLERKDATQFVLLYGFLATATTIVSGAVLARMNIYAYILSTIFLAMWIYPVSTFWMWNESGWLYQIGAIDNAGGAVVHIVGGSAALAACYLSGPRHGRYMKAGGKWVDLGIAPHNVVLQTMGCMLLYIGWFAFNGSSLYVGRSSQLVLTGLRNTLLGGSAGFMTVFLYTHVQKKPVYPKQRVFLVPSLTGALAGLAGVTCNCGVTTGWAALLIGSSCSLACAKSSELLARWRIDDPVDAIAVHLVAGSLGTLLTGLFATDSTIHLLRDKDWLPGLFYPPYSFHLLGCQLLSVIVYTCWSGVQTFALLYIVKTYICKKAFRYSNKAQIRGLDYALYGGVAYPDFTYINVDTSESRSYENGNSDAPNAQVQDIEESEASGEISTLSTSANSSQIRHRHRASHADNRALGKDASSEGTGVDIDIEMAPLESSKVSSGREEGSTGDTLVKSDAKPTLEDQLRFNKGSSEQERHDASPGNRLDQILEGAEARCVVIMTGFRARYSLAAIQREVDRDFAEDYKLIALASTASIVVLQLRTPLVVMRFAAQFKIERWSEGSPGTKITDSGRVVELEAPNVEYCKIQDHDRLVSLMKSLDVQYLEKE